MQTLKVVRHGRIQDKSVHYTSPTAVINLVSKDMRRLDREHFVVLHLDVRQNIIAKETVSIGTLNETYAHPREVFRAAVINGSHAIILVHNHPSGDPTPSKADLETTQRLDDAAEIMGIDILDHIIIGSKTHWSFKSMAALYKNIIKKQEGAKK
jgi:DNA repair protein RadC